MSDTLTTNYNLTKPEVGASNDSWGTKTNANWDVLDAAVKAISTVANAAQTTAGAALPAASYTAADVLTKVKTVDGAGSGLDADLLDGNDATAFLLAAAYTAGDVLTKLKTVDGAGSGLDADLLNGQAPAYYTDIAARLGFTPLNKAGDTIGSLGVTGNLTVGGSATVTGDLTSSSDERLKTDIKELDGLAMLEALAKIGGQSFKMNNKRRMGVIAQRVQAAGLGELVDDKAEYLSVSYTSLIGPLIAALVHLADRVHALESAQ